MILQTGMRTDIPTFYSEWFINRVKEGYVLVRNPYNSEQVTRYEINTEVVDLFINYRNDNMRNSGDYLLGCAISTELLNV